MSDGKNVFESLIGGSHKFKENSLKDSSIQSNSEEREFERVDISNSKNEPLNIQEFKEGESDSIGDKGNFSAQEPIETIDLSEEKEGRKSSYEEKQAEMAAKLYVKSFDIFTASLISAVTGSGSNRPFKMSKEDYNDYLEITTEAFIAMGVTINPAYFFAIATGTAITVKYAAYSEYKNGSKARPNNNKSKSSRKNNLNKDDIEEPEVDFSHTKEKLSGRRYYHVDDNNMYEFHPTDSPRRRLKKSERTESPSQEIQYLIDRGESSVRIRKLVLNE